MGSSRNFDDAIVFRASPIKNFMFLIAFLAVLSLFVYDLLLDNIGFIGKTFFVVGTICVLWVIGLVGRNLLWWRDVVVAVGRRGIYDKRLSGDWILWPGISAIDVYRVSSKSFSWRCGVSLELSAAARQAIRETTNARLTRVMNEPFGYPGFTVTMAATDGSQAALKAALQQYCPQRQTVLSQELQT